MFAVAIGGDTSKIDLSETESRLISKINPCESYISKFSFFGDSTLHLKNENRDSRPNRAPAPTEARPASALSALKSQELNDQGTQGG